MGAVINITRIRDNGIQTIGTAEAFANKERLAFVTLEPSWMLNTSHISCIDIGCYNAKKRESAREGKHFHILKVPDRSYILMHVGNFRKNSEGCILVGSHFALINNDKLVDVANSGATMDKLQNMMPDTFQIDIMQHPQFQSFY